MSRGHAIVLIDSRPQLGLELVLQDHLRFLPGWQAVVFSSVKNRYVCQFGATFHEVAEDAANSWSRHSEFMTAPQMWDALAGFERVMIVQQDSRLLRFGVDEFLEWDYVGAPWVGPWIESWIAAGRLTQRVGNGGLSLRNPRMCLAATREFPRDSADIVPLRGRLPFVLEDVFFSATLSRVGARIAPEDVAARFSCETAFALGTFGCHAIHRHLTPTEVERVLTRYYPVLDPAGRDVASAVREPVYD